MMKMVRMTRMTKLVMTRMTKMTKMIMTEPGETCNGNNSTKKTFGREIAPQYKEL